MRFSNITAFGAIALGAITLSACSGTNTSGPVQAPTSVESGRAMFADICLNSGANFENFETRAKAGGLSNMSSIGEPGEVFYAHETTGVYALLNPEKTSCAFAYELPNRAADAVSDATFANTNPNGFDISFFPSDGKSNDSKGANVLIAMK